MEKDIVPVAAEGVSVRLLHEEEISACAALIREAFSDIAVDFGLSEANCPGNGAFVKEEKLRADFLRGVRMFGLFSGGRQVGFVALKRKNDEVYYLEKLAVVPECRHQGHGAALLRHALDQARQAGGQRISIGIIDANERLKRWYAGHGFSLAGTKEFAGLPFTVCYMTYDL